MKGTEKGGSEVSWSQGLKSQKHRWLGREGNCRDARAGWVERVALRSQQQGEGKKKAFKSDESKRRARRGGFLQQGGE